MAGRIVSMATSNPISLIQKLNISLAFMSLCTGAFDHMFIIMEIYELMNEEMSFGMSLQRGECWLLMTGKKSKFSRLSNYHATYARSSLRRAGGLDGTQRVKGGGGQVCQSPCKEYEGNPEKLQQHMSRGLRLEVMRRNTEQERYKISLMITTLKASIVVKLSEKKNAGISQRFFSASA